jgi:hypothetical protein
MLRKKKKRDETNVSKETAADVVAGFLQARHSSSSSSGPNKAKISILSGPVLTLSIEFTVEAFWLSE